MVCTVEASPASDRGSVARALAINPGGTRPLAVVLGNRPQLALVGDYGAPGQARVDACIGTLCASAAPDRSGVATVAP